MDQATLASFLQRLPLLMGADQGASVQPHMSQPNLPGAMPVAAQPQHPGVRVPSMSMPSMGADQQAQAPTGGGSMFGNPMMQQGGGLSSLFGPSAPAIQTPTFGTTNPLSFMAPGASSPTIMPGGMVDLSLPQIPQQGFFSRLFG